MVDWPPKLIERLNAPTGEEEFNTLLPIGSARNASQQQQQLENLHGRTLNLPNYYVTHSKVYFEVFSACIIAFLLNLLDVITYGRIVFPSLPSTIGSMSVTAPNTMVMTILTSVIAQLCFTAFSSMDYGVLAGMMVEVIPFYHAYFWTIYHTLALDEPILTDFSSLYPTLFFMVFISSASIALLFYILGTSFLSKLLQFFPRSLFPSCQRYIFILFI